MNRLKTILHPGNLPAAWCLLGLLASPHPAGGGSLTPEGWMIPTPNRDLNFPHDHGSHPGFRLEWWYLTGHLFTTDRDRYGFHATFFRIGHRPPGNDPAAAAAIPDAFGRNEIFLAHMALTDVSRQAFHHEERFNRDGWDAWARVGDLDARNGNWTLRRVPATIPNHPEQFQLHGSIRSDIGFDLELTAAKPHVVFGPNGVSRKGPDPEACSYYITFPRLRVTGSLTLPSGRRTVNGSAWMDHEISSSQLGRDQIGWNWAGIQLDDGRELMVYVMRNPSGEADPYSTLSWVDPSGNVSHQGVESFEWIPGRRWESPESGASYPVDSILRTRDPRNGKWTEFRLHALVDSQELTGHLSGIDYWEGASQVLDASGTPVGSAYVELTGYAESLEEKLR